MMMNGFGRAAFVLGACLLLCSCLITPGKFASTLDIRADRGFTFAYKGEVIALDLPREMSKGLPGAGKPDSSATPGTSREDWPGTGARAVPARPAAFAPGEGGAAGKGGPATPDFSNPAANDAKMKAMAEALSKEAGYRSVQYLGKGRFLIDYEIHGTLDHGFVYPFNIDAEIVFPFVAVELRGADMVRVKAPGFANSEGRMGGMGAPGPAENAMDGSFTLTTDAEIVSQNNESGAVAVAGGRKIVWKATPLSKDEPTAVLRLAPAKAR